MSSEDNRARESDLADLHGIFAKFLSCKLKSGEVTGPELNCIRQFLKDNGKRSRGKPIEIIDSN